MLYFSKLRIITVLLFTIILSYFALSNFTKLDDNFFSKNINLGLDLQGGSYLLLEIDNNPVINQKLQAKIIELKKYFKDKNLVLRNFSLENDFLSFEVSDGGINQVIDFLDKDDSDINPYYSQYKSHEFDIEKNNNFIKLSFSRYGLVLLKKFIIRPGD